MSDELNRLRADLEVLERYNQSIYLDDTKRVVRDKIARLESEADPWRDLREILSEWNGALDNGKAIGEKACNAAAQLETLLETNDHLTAELDAKDKRIAGLEAKNAIWVKALKGFDPDELDPARVLATAAEILKMIRDITPSLHPVEGLLQRTIFAVEQYSRYGLHEYPMPYKLKEPAK